MSSEYKLLLPQSAENGDYSGSVVQIGRTNYVLTEKAILTYCEEYDLKGMDYPFGMDSLEMICEDLVFAKMTLPPPERRQFFRGKGRRHVYSGSFKNGSFFVNNIRIIKNYDKTIHRVPRKNKKVFGKVLERRYIE